MSVIIIAAVIALMPVFTFLLVRKGEMQSSENSRRAIDLSSIYEYKNFLIDARQIKNKLYARLDSINYNDLQYQTYFSPFEINILKKNILNQMNMLEDEILSESISVEEFYLKIDELNKRTDILCL